VEFSRMYITDTDLIKFPLLVPNVAKVDFSCKI
jgi:hypothetical protein